MEKDKAFLKAKDYAYRLLSYRQRSTDEIKERLKKKGFKPQIVEATVRHLSQLDYLNDEKFARFWIRTKTKISPVGWSVLRYQLRQKGITAEVLKKACTECAAEYNEIDAAKKLVISRRQHYWDLEPLKIKARLYRYLCRRGFSQEAISEALRQV